MPLDNTTLRNIFGHFATGVIVVTAETASGERLGMTMSSFNTVSLDPPLILFSIHRNARSFPAWQSVDRYAVNILGSNQEDVANRFARAKDDKWEGVRSSVASGEAPILSGCPLSIQCEAQARFDGGDHEIFLGKVVSFQKSETASTYPLVFYGGRFRALAPERAHTPADDAVYLHGW
jgi:flavin reductase (DIM6/NTAB) family NADH-FMN oxidoreductase RutF